MEADAGATLVLELLCGGVASLFLMLWREIAHVVDSDRAVATLSVGLNSV